VNNFLKQPLQTVRRYYEVIQAIMDGLSLEAAIKYKRS
jgi:hypothetical protein